MTQDTPTVEDIVRGLEQMEMQDRDGLITKDAYEYLYAELHTYGNARFEEGVTKGRVSVLQDFDNMCMADAFMGFTDEEWSAVRKFFAFNKKISNWDK